MKRKKRTQGAKSKKEKITSEINYKTPKEKSNTTQRKPVQTHRGHYDEVKLAKSMLHFILFHNTDKDTKRD